MSKLNSTEDEFCDDAEYDIWISERKHYFETSLMILSNEISDVKKKLDALIYEMKGVVK